MMRLHQNLQRSHKESFKERLHRFFHMCVTTCQVSNLVFIIMLLLEACSLWAFVFYYKPDQVWSDQLSHAFSFAVLPFSPGWIWPSMSPFVHLCFVVMALCVSIALLVVAGFQISEGYKKEANTNMAAIKVFTYASLFIRTVLLQPILSAGIMMWSRRDLAILIGEGPTRCISICTVIIYLGHSWITIILLVENSPFTSHPLSESEIFSQIFKTIIKLVLAIFAEAATTNESISIGITAGVLTISIGILYLFFINAPAPVKSINLTKQIIFVVLCWLCICNLVQLVVLQGQKTSFWLSVGTSGLVWLLWRSLKAKYYDYILCQNYLQLHSPKQLLLYNRLCIGYILDLPSSSALISLEGILSLHIQNCQRAQAYCQCRYFRREIDKAQTDIKQQEKFWFLMVKGNLLEIQEKYKMEVEIHLLMAELEHFKLYNKYKSLHNLEMVEDIPTTVRQDFLRHHQRLKVQEKMLQEDRVGSQHKTAESHKFFTFEGFFGEFQSVVEEATQQACHFWGSLIAEKVTLSQIINQGTEMLAKLQVVNSLERKINQLCSNHLYSLVLYCHFMKSVMNKPSLMARNITIIKSIRANLEKGPRSDRDKYSENSSTSFIIISGQRKNIGVIKHCSTRVREILNYGPSDLIGQNINTLMPKFIGNMHDNVLMNYLERSESQFDNVQRLAPMINQDGYLVFSQILTKPLPNLINGLELIGFCTAVREFHLNHPSDIPKYLLYRSDNGQIQAMSESCENEFNLKVTRLDSKNQTFMQLSLTQLFPDLDSEKRFVKKDEGFETRLLTTHSSVPVVVYLRHQIIYFGVKLKLLYFFKSNTVEQPALLFQSSASMMIRRNKAQQNFQFNENQPNNRQAHKQGQQTNISRQNAPLREKHDDRMFTSKSFWQVVFRRGGCAIFLLLMSLACLSVFLTYGIIGLFIEFKEISQLNSWSAIDAIDIVYHGRMMQVSAQKTGMSGIFQEHARNLSKLTPLLQGAQFDIVNMMLSLSKNGFAPNVTAMTYRRDNTKMYRQESTTLDLCVFDFVTSASTFTQASQSMAAIKFDLKDRTTTSDLLFHMRNTLLFSLVSAKSSIDKVFSDYYSSAMLSAIKNQKLRIVAICLSIVVPFILAAWVMRKILLMALEIVLLYGYVDSVDVDIILERCEQFRMTFFSDSEKSRQSSFENNAEKPSFYKDFSVTKIPKNKDVRAETRQSETQEANENRRSSRRSVDYGAIIGNDAYFQNTLSGTLQPQQAPLAQNRPEGVSLMEKLAKDQNHFGYSVYFSLVLLFFYLSVYFIAESLLIGAFYQFVSTEIFCYRNQMSHFRTLSLLRLVALEAALDPNNPAGKSVIPETLETTFQAFLENQKTLFDYTTNETLPLTWKDRLSSLATANMCNYLQNLKATKRTPAEEILSLNINECSQLGNGALELGARYACLATAETMFIFSRLLSTFSPQKLRIQSYIRAVLISQLAARQESLTQSFNQIRTNLVIAIVFNSLLGILVLWQGWFRLAEWLKKQLDSAQLIFGFIPKIIIARNHKLAQQAAKLIQNDKKK